MVESTEAKNEFIMKVSLRKAKLSSKARRSDSGIGVLKSEVSKHMRVPEENIWIDPKVNEKIWERGRKKIPGKIEIRVVKLSEDSAEVILPQQ